MKDLLLISGILIALFVTYHLVWFLRFKRTFVPVFMYHRVTDDEKPESVRYTKHKSSMLNLDSMKARPSEFEAQLRYLKLKGYQTCLLDENIFKHKNKAVYLTFDDGYVDNYTNAFPILKKYGFKGTFYITSGLVENSYMPIDRNDPRVMNRLMTFLEIKTMAEAGMQIGAHTLTHPWLVDASVDIELEIIGSKSLLIDKGMIVNTFAYPGGLYNEAVLAIVKTHYQTAVITSRGQDFKMMRQDIYEIERETISRGESMLSFKLKLYGIHRFLRKLPWLNFIRKVISWLFKRS